MSARMPIALQVTIPTSSPPCISSPSSSSKSTSAGSSSASSPTGPGIYIPVHRRAASSQSSSRGSSSSPPSPQSLTSSDFPARIYNLATLLRLSCSPLATKMASAPAMRAVPAILGVRPRKKHSTASSPTTMSSGTQTEKVGHTEAVSASATVQAATRRPTARRNTISRERSALEENWRPRCPESTGFTTSTIPVVEAV